VTAILRPDRGIGPQSELATSRNGYYSLSNPCADAVKALINGGLTGYGMEFARRTVDITFNAVGAEVSQVEKDRLAYLLDAGFLDEYQSNLRKSVSR